MSAEEISAELKAARTAWHEEFGVPVSETYARFLEAIGKATDYLDELEEDNGMPILRR